MNANRITTPVLAAAMLLGVAGAAAAQEAGPGWLAWTGCWEAVAAPDARADAPVVCVVPGAGARAAAFVTLRDGALADRQPVTADGERHSVDRGGCAGWESARWAEDGYRLFLRSELDCAGVKRASSTILAILPDGQWLDARALESGGEAYVSVQRYHPFSGDAERIAGIEATVRERAAAIHAARDVAGARLSVRDVTEASRHAHPGAVQALIAERGTGFGLDAETLVALSDAGVPGETTDLMVALSFPDVFEVDRGSRRAAARTADPGAAGVWGADPWAAPARDPWRGGGRADRWGRGGWSPYGSCYGGCYDYGYGYNYGYGYGNRYPYGYGTGRPPIVVVRRREDPDNGGKVVNGRGYTRGRPAAQGTATATPAADGRAQANGSRGGSNGGSAGASSGSSAGGEEKTERRAKRRSGGN